MKPYHFVKCCKGCYKNLALAEFYKHASSKDGYSYYCRGCTAIRNKKKAAKCSEP